MLEIRNGRPVPPLFVWLRATRVCSNESRIESLLAGRLVGGWPTKSDYVEEVCYRYVRRYRVMACMHGELSKKLRDRFGNFHKFRVPSGIGYLVAVQEGRFCRIETTGLEDDSDIEKYRALRGVISWTAHKARSKVKKILNKRISEQAKEAMILAVEIEHFLVEKKRARLK